jgi:DNA-binding NarL/FixJ family response regulator
VTVRVLIADDQELVRTGVRLILEAEDDLEVVAEAADGQEALDLVRRHRPDVVLMDVQMPRLDGLEATRRLLRDPETEGTRVVVLTTFDVDAYVLEALRAGASGFMVKDMPAGDIVSGVRAVARGDALLAPSVTRRFIETVVGSAQPAAPPARFDDLTSREVEVFTLVARGLSNADIARELFLGETTVKTHVARILMKLGLTSRVQVVVLAYETGLVRPGDAG